MDAAAWILIVVTGAAIALSLLLTLQVWEHRRFARSRCRTAATHPPKQHVLLLAPCKGLDAGLADNLRPLFRQDHPHYQLALIVESAADPAVDVIEELLVEFPKAKAELVIAGRATQGGQKVHNLLAALQNIPSDVEIIAFVDSDARPKPEWLRLLVRTLESGQADAATAYRWFIPARASLANFLLYSINSAVAAYVGPSRHSIVWGGSWAIRKDVLKRSGLLAAWQGTLSDDLVASRVLGECRARVKFEPACMAASPLDMNAREVAEFVRRQFIIGRRYSPRWWLAALLYNTLAQLTFWGLLAFGFCNIESSPQWATRAALAASALYFLGTLRAWMRQSASQTYLPAWQAKLGDARWFDILSHPLGGLANCLCLVASCLTNNITWRGIRYRIHRGGQASILNRPTPTQTGTEATTLPLRRAG